MTEGTKITHIQKPEALYYFNFTIMIKIGDMINLKYLKRLVWCAGILVTFTVSANALHEAAKRGDIDKVKAAILGGADVNMKGKDGESALWEASYLGALDVVKYLIANGADTNTTNNNRQSALSVAVEGEEYEIADVLLEDGADIDASDEGGTSPLMIAAESGYYDLSKLLLKNGANINLTNNMGRSSLMIAAMKDNCKLEKLFLENGADVNIKDKDGMDAYALAVINVNSDCVKMLTEKGARKKTLREIVGDNADLINKIIPKMESRITDIISMNGVEGRYVIPDITPKPGRSGSITIKEAGVTGVWLLEMEYPGEYVPIVNGMPQMPFGNYSIHRFSGTVDFNKTYRFRSKDDKLNRLTFLLKRDIGYVYLRGNGTVENKKTHEIVKLGQ